jgi:hypothetical protein
MTIGQAIPLVLLAVAFVGAPIGMRLMARSASFGTPPGAEQQEEPLYRAAVKARWNRRRFGPARIYDLVVKPTAVGVVISQEVGPRLARVLASRLYPSWWFLHDDVQVGHLAMPGRAMTEVTFSYKKNGERQVVGITPRSLLDVTAALEAGGWAVEPGA